jgi:hypothetical protein
VNGGCTGAMLTNRRVLTAHRCVRGYDDVLEPPTPWGINARDHAILRLDGPLSVEGESDHFYNTLYSGSDASLLNQVVTCIGYGGTTEATAMTFAGGSARSRPP